MRRSEDAKMKILDMVADGKISADEAAKLLEALEPKHRPFARAFGICDTEEPEGEELDESGEFKKTFTAQGKEWVSVRNINGNIEFEAWDKDEIEVVASTPRGKGAKAPRFTISETEEGVEVKTVGHRNLSVFGMPIDIGMHGVGRRGSQIDYKVRLPARLDASGKTTNGRVTCAGLSGQTTASTTNGAIRCSGLTGDVTLKSVNGSIVGKGLGCKNLEAKTVNGEMSLAPTEGLKGSWAAKTVNGAIGVYLAEPASLKVEARTVSGHIESDFEMTSSWLGRKRLEGTIGAGDLSLTVKNVNGRIRISKLTDENRQELERKFAEPATHSRDVDADDIEVEVDVDVDPVVDAEEIRESVREAMEGVRESIGRVKEEFGGRDD
jgi:DUF4097 and DUF4098 domain-containing protein YvlB